MKAVTALTLFVLISACTIAKAQTDTSNLSKASVVPKLVKFSGVARESTGGPLSGIVGITFALYKDEEGGPSLWRETQNVAVDKTGHYTVSLGLTEAEGIPAELFITGDARWLGVQVDRQPESHRVLLMSVPYAVKAGDADTIGGLPPSAFVLANGSTSGSVVADASSPNSSGTRPAATATGLGTVNYLPIWTSTTNLGNSALYQSGVGSLAKLGINITAPTTTLDLNGAGPFAGR